MTIPVISSLPEIPAYSDANFETKAPAVLSALRNTFIAEMNAAISAINNYDYGAAVNANIITGQVAVANGGTGLSTLAAGRIPYGNAANPLDSSENLTYVGGLLIAKRASLSALRLINTNNNYDTDPTVTESVLTMRRAGKSGYSFDSGVEFGIGRYEVSSLNARTQFDIRLAHTASLADIIVMSLRSNGNVGIGTTAPSRKMHIKDEINPQIRLEGASGAFADFNVTEKNLEVNKDIKQPNYRNISTTSSEKTGTPSTYDLTITLSSATNTARIGGKFTGLLIDALSYAYTHFFSFDFLIRKLTTGNVECSVGNLTQIDGTAPTIDSIAVTAFDTSSATITVTMTSTVFGSLLVSKGVISAYEAAGSIASAEWE